MWLVEVSGFVATLKNSKIWIESTRCSAYITLKQRRCFVAVSVKGRSAAAVVFKPQWGAGAESVLKSGHFPLTRLTLWICLKA